jgi:hypothetical protein
MFQTNVVEKIKIQFYVQYFFLFENRAVYGLMQKNVVEPGLPQITHTHYEIPLVFNANNGYADALQCYIIYTSYITRIVYNSRDKQRLQH